MSPGVSPHLARGFRYAQALALISLIAASTAVASLFLYPWNVTASCALTSLLFGLMSRRTLNSTRHHLRLIRSVRRMTHRRAASDWFEVETVRLQEARRLMRSVPYIANGDRAGRAA